jgi:predicted permease
MILNVIYAITEMFGMFAAGALVMRLNILEEQDINKLSKMIIDVLFPMMVFSSITRNFDPSQLQELWLMPLFGFGLMFFGGMLGFIFRYGMKNKGEGRMITFHHYCAVNNYVFLPLIVLSNLWGEKYLPLLFIMNIGSTIGFWTVGVGLLAGGNLKRTFKNIFTVNLGAVVIALIFCFANIPVPTVAASIFRKLGDASVPLMLMVIGAAIYSNRGKVLKNKWDITYLTLVRLILLPLIIIGVLKLLPVPADVYRVVFVVSLMPVSASSAVITRRFGGSPDFASQAIIITTIASVATIPLMLCLL